MRGTRIIESLIPTLHRPTSLGGGAWMWRVDALLPTLREMAKNPGKPGKRCKKGAKKGVLVSRHHKGTRVFFSVDSRLRSL